MEKIPVNYTSPASKLAEENFSNVLERLSIFEIESADLDKTNEEIIESVEELVPGRLKLIREKTGLSDEELIAMPKPALLDKLLAIDRLFSFQGHLCAVDIATGKSSTLINKREKIEKLEAVYKNLGIEHAMILRIKGELTDDVLTEIISKVNDASRENRFLIEIRA